MPNDEFDWDAVQIPVLADISWKGQPRKAMLWANRNGFFYVLDRRTGEFLQATPIAKQNWNAGFDNGTADSHAELDGVARRRADLSGQPGRDQLVQSVVQPAHGPVLRERVGEHPSHLRARRSGI